jgi:NAD+ synthase
MSALRIALAQTNPRMADIEANAARLRALRAQAASQGADLLLTPEHSLSGAVPATLAADPGFAAACDAALMDLAAGTSGIGPALILGAPWRDGLHLHDALALLEGGSIRARRAAHEPRPGFDPGPVPGPVAFRGIRLGLMAGRDWRGPATAETLAETGAEILIALDSLPFETGGEERRLQAALSRVVENNLPLLLLNRLGAEEEDVHDGAALILNADRSPALQLPPFAESLTLTEWTQDGATWRCVPHPTPPAMPSEEQLWRALLLALRDHAARHGAGAFLLPLAATPESLLAATLAADAFGPAALRALHHQHDTSAAEAARELALATESLDLAPAGDALAAAVPQAAPCLVAALSQAVIQALAEATKALPILTGPGTTPTAFAPLRHLSPAQRRALATWRNAHRPTGLLGPEQVALPLDQPAGTPQMNKATPAGHGPALWQSLARADYKRRHSPPGLNIAPRAFRT